MKTTLANYIDVINSTGSPALNLKYLPDKSNALAKWFFVRQEPECEATRLVREYLIELDDTGYVQFSDL